MIPYIISVGLILSGCLTFYKLLLQKETFYHLNRYVLMFCLLVAFSLPLVHVPQQFSFRKMQTSAIITNNNVAINNNNDNKNIDANSNVQFQPEKQVQSTSVNNTFSWKQFMQWMFWLYWFGVIVFALNFFVQMIILLYRAYTNPVIKDGKFRIVEMHGDKAPCSFLNNIFINPEKYVWNVYEQILQHENIHIQQKHSLDILFAELVLIVQWFNPFAWMYRKEIESNLEFLTDDQLVQKEKIEKASYQLSLLKVSAPHFPLSLTTNYNQSLLKKRITMMNTKKSSVHTAWKYFFLLPLLVLLASLLNEPIVKAQDNNITEQKTDKTEHYNNDIKTEGYWFATIKGDRINFRFTQDESDHDNYSGSDFLLNDFTNLPKETKGDFKLTREAGTMNFNGKFDGNQGMGRYKFEPNKDFGDYMSAQNIGKLDDEDLMTFFFVNVTKEYCQMLKEEGFDDISKDNLVALRALKVDKEFISSIKANGYNDVEPDNLTALKALGVDGAYIKEIKDAGYKDISLDQLISFKAQGIDKDYLSKLPKTNKDAMSADNVVSLKALNVDAAYANSFKALGYADIEPEQLVSMKAVGVTPDFVKEFQALGYKDISAENLVALKAQDITPKFIKAFEDAGYKNIEVDNLISLKALGVQPEYIKSFKEKGYDNISLEDAVSMKSQNITPEYLNAFAAVGYKNISLDNAVALKATGVTPDWIKDMKAKGFNYTDINKYIALKSLQ
jgi:beta-lactamase regulating signal transducer with metallopeptidase domain